MSFLTDEINDTFEIDGKVYHVNLSFDNVLLLHEMFDDETVFKEEKMFLALEMLIDEYDQIRFETFEQYFDLYKYVMKEFLGYDLEQEKGEKPEKVYDFQKDAELIFASFFAVYKIDLIEMQGKLHWKKFITLMAHLDEKSPFKKVVGYRSMKIPNSKEASEEYIKHVRKMKEQYSLDERAPEEKVNDAFDVVAQVFKSSAKAGEK